MKTIDLLKRFKALDWMPSGTGVFTGITIAQIAKDDHSDIISFNSAFRLDKSYYVVWDSSSVKDLVACLPNYDVLIIDGDSRKFLWELE